jgi:hypothetical protein
MKREPWKIVLDAWSLDLVGKIEALSDDALEELVPIRMQGRAMPLCRWT